MRRTNEYQCRLPGKHQMGYMKQAIRDDPSDTLKKTVVRWKFGPSDNTISSHI